MTVLDLQPQAFPSSTDGAGATLSSNGFATLPGGSKTAHRTPARSLTTSSSSWMPSPRGSASCSTTASGPSTSSASTAPTASTAWTWPTPRTASWLRRGAARMPMCTRALPCCDVHPGTTPHGPFSMEQDRAGTPHRTRRLRIPTEPVRNVLLPAETRLLHAHVFARASAPEGAGRARSGRDASGPRCGRGPFALSGTNVPRPQVRGRGRACECLRVLHSRPHPRRRTFAFT